MVEHLTITLIFSKRRVLRPHLHPQRNPSLSIHLQSFIPSNSNLRWRILLELLKECHFQPQAVIIMNSVKEAPSFTPYVEYCPRCQVSNFNYFLINLYISLYFEKLISNFIPTDSNCDFNRSQRHNMSKQCVRTRLLKTRPAKITHRFEGLSEKLTGQAPCEQHPGCCSVAGRLLRFHSHGVRPVNSLLGDRDDMLFSSLDTIHYFYCRSICEFLRVKL